MKIQEETDVKEYQIRKKKSREQTVENIENKEKEVKETEPETTKEEDEHVKEMGMLSLDPTSESSDRATHDHRRSRRA